MFGFYFPSSCQASLVSRLIHFTPQAVDLTETQIYEGLAPAFSNKMGSSHSFFKKSGKKGTLLFLVLMLDCQPPSTCINHAVPTPAVQYNARLSFSQGRHPPVFLEL